jgi:VWFA-related protein
MRRAAFPLLAACLLAGPVSASQDKPADPKPADPRTNSLYVGVVDGRGNAVTGLTAKDFTVREEGAPREVLRAEPATEPIDLVVLVDDSQAATTAIPNLRDGLAKFLTRMEGKGTIGIVTVGERPMSVVERTKDAAALQKGVKRIFARRGAGAYLLEGINEVIRGFRRRPGTRPTILALTIEGVEFSNLQQERVIGDLLKTDVALHVLAIGTPAPTDTDEMRNRNLVLSMGTEYTGGRRDQLLSTMAIEERLEQVAAELLNQYVVTYGRPDALVPPEKVQVTVNKPGLTARARTRLPQKK